MCPAGLASPGRRSQSRSNALRSSNGTGTEPAGGAVADGITSGSTGATWERSPAPLPGAPSSGAWLRQMLLRKEVIQPHLPVRLPCYDFTPIADPTFDGSLHKGWATGFGCYRLSWCDGRCVQGPGTYSPQRC